MKTCGNVANTRTQYRWCKVPAKQNWMTYCIGQFSDEELFLQIIPFANEFSIQQVNWLRLHFRKQKQISFVLATNATYQCTLPQRAQIQMIMITIPEWVQNTAASKTKISIDTEIQTSRTANVSSANQSKEILHYIW